MDKFSILREEMVNSQLRRRGIRDDAVLKAFLEVPRHKFVEEDMAYRAYDDNPLAIGYNQTISQPYIVGLMSEALDLKANSKVLEIGTGSGYQTAILSKIVEKIYTIERIPFLLNRAKEVLDKLCFTNIEYRIADGTKGWVEEAPFDAILVAAGTNKAPKALLDQLAIGASLIIPLGNRFFQELTLITKTKEGIRKKSLGSVAFVPLLSDE